MSYLLISIIPLLIDALNVNGREDEYRSWAGAVFSFVHSQFAIPIVTILCIAAFFAQAKTIRSRDNPGALSKTGLAVQAVVFAFIAIAWIGRLGFPWDKVDEFGPSLGLLTYWYQWVGWVTVDSAIFAVAQGVLFWLASRHQRGVGADAVGGETEPLLRG